MLVVSILSVTDRANRLDPLSAFFETRMTLS